MSREITCALCGRPVDDQDTVEMPNGPICMHPCYEWLERMIEESGEIDDDDDEDCFIVVIDPDQIEWDDE